MKRETIGNFLLSVLILCPVVYFLKDHFVKFNVVVCCIVSVIGMLITIAFVPFVNKMLLGSRVRLFGYDLNKGEAGKKKKVPEPLGIVSGMVYLVSVCAILGITYKVEENSELVLLDYCAGLFCSCFMLFLGFCDDVLNLRWRYKIILPFFAMVPMILCYTGETNILVPLPLRDRLGLGHHLEIGIFYKLYMAFLSVYCSNTINIYAGINGLECGQSIVIAVFVIIHNLLELDGPYSFHHEFSLICMIPFLFTTLGLTYHNWYPSSVFVGDSFTYFSGMTFAVVGILGHFSKTLMLFFIPQWINFLYSLPQLLHIVKIPRHRVPKFNPETGLLNDSGNMTLINLVLRIYGPMKERSLTIVLCVFQVLCCALGLFLRYKLMELYYPVEETMKYIK